MIFLNASKWTDAQGDRPDPQLRSKPKKDYEQGREPFSEIRTARPQSGYYTKTDQVNLEGLELSSPAQKRAGRILQRHRPHPSRMRHLRGDDRRGYEAIEMAKEAIEAYVESLVARRGETP